MISRLLRLVSLVCCFFIVASFAMFVVDQAASASKTEQRSLDQPGASAQPAAPAHRHGQPRRFIEDVAGKLTQPFRSLISARSAWVLELVSTAIALLVYGFALRFLARFASGSAAGVLLKPV